MSSEHLKCVNDHEYYKSIPRNFLHSYKISRSLVGHCGMADALVKLSFYNESLSTMLYYICIEPERVRAR